MAAAASWGRGKRKRTETTRVEMKKLLPGERVEVLSSDEGLNGSWHKGVVLGCGKCSRLIEYTELVNDDDRCSKLVERIPVSPAIEGIARTMPRGHRGQIRPLPPPYEFQQSEISYGICVDALVNDVWWEGVVFDHNEGLMERLVFFPDQGDQQMIRISRMRITQEWDEVTGCWNARGEWMMLQVLQTFEQEDALPVSIREIWYDLRTMTAFQKKIGVWTSGAQLEWHSLVFELIQELISVAYGLTVAEKIPSPLIIGTLTNYDDIGIPMEDIPHPEGTNIQTGDDGEHARIAFIASPAHDSEIVLPDQTSTECIYNSPMGKSHNRICYQETAEGKVAEPLRNGICEKAPPSDDIYFSHQPGYCPEAVSDFIFECRIRVGHRTPCLRKRFSLVRELAMAHLLAVGWKLKKIKRHNYYVSPDGKSYGSFIKACEALHRREGRGDTESTTKDNATSKSLTCYKKDAETNIGFIPNQNKAARGTVLQVANSWKPVDLEAEYSPEAITICAGSLKDGKPLPKKLKFKKHLLTLGWRIETRQGNKFRLRFVSPKGKCFYSHNPVCHYLLEEQQMKDRKCRHKRHSDEGPHKCNLCGLLPSRDHSESTSLVHLCEKKCSCHQAEEDGKKKKRVRAFSNNLQSYVLDDSHITKVYSTKVPDAKSHRDAHCSIARNPDFILKNSEKKSHMEEVIEPRPIPESILAYKEYMELSQQNTRNSLSKDANLLRLNAKNHLLLMGWRFSIRVHKARQWAVYHSPSGKSYYSIYAACKALLEVENTGSVVRLSRGMHPRKGLGGQSNNDRSQTLVKKDSSFLVSSSALDRRMLTWPWVCSTIYQKPKRRKGTQVLHRQGHKSGGRFLPYALRSGKRSQGIMVKSHSQCVTRTVLSWLVDNDVVLPRQKVRYINQRDGHVKMEGRITRDGIRCNCCKRVYSLTNFEVHAGSSTLRPAANIFLQDGRSLLECQVQVLRGKKFKDIRHAQLKSDPSLHQSDTICSICNDGGNLLLCDLCPSSFHLSCIGLEDVPEGKWFCPTCRCGICGLCKFNCDDEQFTEKTVLCCDQCERQYHVRCMGKQGLKGLKTSPIGKWFCSKSCSKIFRHLQKLLGISKPTGVGLSLNILRWSSEVGVGFGKVDIETMADHHSKLCVALDVLHECFVTMIEPRTQSDLVADLLFNNESDLSRLSFRGFYTMLLHKGDDLISVAAFRVFGAKVAEMPLVGTRVQYRRQGMCRLLVGELEKLLSAMGVERLVLPAVPQLLETWTNSFGFTKMSSSERLKFLNYMLLNFQDTTMCHKLLSRAKPVSEKPKGKCKQLIDSANNNINNSNSSKFCRVPDSVEMVDLVHSKGSCLSGEGDSSGRIGPQTGQSTLDGQLVVNSPGKCRDSCSSLKNSPLPVVVKPSTEVKLNSPGRCCEHNGQTGTSRESLIKTRDVAPASVFKYYYYRKKISTTYQASSSRL